MICQIFLLPQISGFPLLWASLAICLLPGIWLQFHPRHGLRAFGYVVFFMAMINVHNPITFNDLDLFNTWLAMLLGCIGLVLVFRVLLPPVPERDVRRLAASLARAVASLPRMRRVPHWEDWQFRQMRKILRLMQRLDQAPHLPAVPTIQAAFAVVALGRAIIALRGMKDPIVRDALMRLAPCRARPATAEAEIETLLHSLHPPEQDQAPDAPPPNHRLVGTLGEILIMLRKSAPLLQPDCPVLAMPADRAAC